MIPRSCLVLASAALLTALPNHDAAAHDMAHVYAAALGVTLTRPLDDFVASPIDADELGGMRGGFSLPGGLAVTFGFDIETRVNGLPVQRLTLPNTALVHGAIAQLQITEGGTTRPISAASGPVVVDRAVNSGATRVLTEIGPGGVTGVVQNRGDNTSVDRRTTIDVDIQGMRTMMSRIGAQAVMSGALSQARRPSR